MDEVNGLRGQFLLLFQERDTKISDAKNKNFYSGHTIKTALQVHFIPFLELRKEILKRTLSPWKFFVA